MLARVCRRNFRSTARVLDVFKDKELGEENLYFRKEDKVLLEKLLKKMKAQEDDHAAQLKVLIAPHSLPDDTLQKIVDWKMH